jgi:hypothetical protein
MKTAINMPQETRDHSPIGHPDSGLLTLESSQLTLLLDPHNGGKVRSLVSKDSGFEFLYQDPRKDFSGPGYSDHDITGMDECFPAVAPSHFPGGAFAGLQVPDHGVLWNKNWDARETGEAVILSCHVPSMGIEFIRSCALLEENEIRFGYRIRNLMDEPLPFIHACHLMLTLEKDTEIVYPADMNRAYIYSGLNYPDLEVGGWMDCGQVHSEVGKNGYSPDRGSALKFFSNRLREGSVTIVSARRDERLIIDFDTQRLPYLGVMISQGYGPSGNLDGEMILGLEPTTSVGDDFCTSENTSTTGLLEPLTEFNFCVHWRLERIGAHA